MEGIVNMTEEELKDEVRSFLEDDSVKSWVYLHVLGGYSSINGDFSDKDALNFIKHILSERQELKRLVSVKNFDIEA
jgi:hypothetical protein